MAQTYENWECLIVDDYSSDRTCDIVKQYQGKDSRFFYFHKNRDYRKGLSGTRNQGLDIAKMRGAKFIQFVDDDDVMHPQMVEVSVEALLNKPQYDFCHFNKKSFVESVPEMEFISSSGNFYEIGFNQIEQVLTNKIPMASCTVLWKEKCFRNIGFNEFLEYAEEWECYSRILFAGHSGIGIHKTLYYNRKHADSNTGEFWRGKSTMKASKVKAAKLIVENLRLNNLLSFSFIRYFIQLGIFLKDPTMVEYVLQKSNAGLYVRTKYMALYKFYPVVEILYRLRKKARTSIFINERK